MPKRIEEFVSENREGFRRINSSFIAVSGQPTRNLTFNHNEIDVQTDVRVYTRPLNDGLVSGHPDAQHGSGRGVSGDQRGEWTLVDTTTASRSFSVQGRNVVADALAGESGSFIGGVAIGSDAANAIPSDTSLRSKTAEEFAWPEDGASDNEAVANSIFPFTVSEFSELGTLTQDDRFYNRITLEGATSDSEQEVKIEVVFTVTGSARGVSNLTEVGESRVADSFGAIGTPITLDRIAFGSGDSDPSKSDAALETPEFEKPATYERAQESITSQAFVYRNEPTNQPLELSEVGILDEDGNLLWRTVFETFEKDENTEIRTDVRFRVK